MMDLIKIDLELPDIIIDVNEKMKKITNELGKKVAHGGCIIPFSIAGGCLSNLYMKKSMNDIDIFIEFSIDMGKPDITLFEEVFNTKINSSDYFVDTRYEFIDHPMIYRFEYRDFPIEIVFCNDLNRIYDFDLRFRQFYLVNDDVLTTKEAINDINDKKLVLSSPCSALSSYVRLKHFEEELGFKIDSFSEKTLLYLIDKKNYHSDGVIEFIQKKKKLNEKVREKLVKWVEEHTELYPENDLYYLKINEASFPFSDDLKTIIDRNILHLNGIERNLFGGNMGVWGKNFERLRDYENDINIHDFSFNLHFHDIKDAFSTFVDDWYSYLKTLRIKSITEGKEIKKWIGLNESRVIVDHASYICFFDELYQMMKKKDYKSIYDILSVLSFENNEIIHHPKSCFYHTILSEYTRKTNKHLVLNFVHHFKNSKMIVTKCDYFQVDELDEYLNKNIKYIQVSAENPHDKTYHYGIYKVSFEQDAIKITPDDNSSEKFFYLSFFERHIQNELEKIILDNKFIS